MIAFLEIQELAHAWTEDRDSMGDENLEALLDAVRDIHDMLGRSLPVTIIWLWADYDIPRISLAAELCEEALRL